VKGFSKATWPAATLAAALAAFVGGAEPARARGHTAADGPPGTNQTAGRAFHLRVVAADTGKPIPNATVRVWIALNGGEWRTADDQGRLDIVHSTGPADRDVLDVDVWGDGCAMQRHSWISKPGEPIPDGATVKLLPGEALGGTVRDEQGLPVVGATVYLWSHNYKKDDPHEILFDLRATTDIDGRWKTSGAPETTGEILGIRINHPGYISDRNYTGDRAKPTIADLRAGKAVSVMKTGVAVEGRVFADDGRPVAGARVFSALGQGMIYDDAIGDFVVTTDADGRFRIGQVGPKQYFLIALAEGHAPGEARVTVGKDAPHVQIDLGRPHTFQGRVVDQAGTPIEGIFVKYEWRGNRFLNDYRYTDADGRFRWDNAPGDPFLVSAYPLDNIRGYLGVMNQRIVPREGQDVVFTLRDALGISGKVLDAATGERVKNARVDVGAVDPTTGDVKVWTRPEGGYLWVNDGTLNASFPVEADAYKIRIVGDGYEPFVSRAFRRGERTVSGYDVRLTPVKPAPGP
jgi:protocatechuate 3,4-dioxygenase beta subunit